MPIASTATPIFLEDARLSAELGFDTTRLHALQAEVRRLNEAALASGLLETRGRAKPNTPAAAVPKAAGPASQAVPKSKKARDRGKLAAARLIALTGRIEDDDSAEVPGTSFTEAGVVRLLARLKRRRRQRTGAWSRFLGRAHRALGRPVPLGWRTVAGISLARLQIFSSQLEQIEAQGLAYLEARRAARRGRLSQTSTLMLGGRQQAAEETPDELDEGEAP